VRVLVVTHEASLSGAPRIALLIARSLGEAGHHVEVVSRRPGPLADGFAALGPFRVEPFHRVRRRLALTPGARRLGRVADFLLAALTILRHRCDLVYLNSTASIAYLRPALFLRRPVVVHSHESAEVAERFVDPARARGALRRARLVACSPSTVGSLARMAGVPVDDVTLLPSVPDAVQVGDRAAASPVGSGDDGTVVIGCCGAVERRKGTDLWLAAARLVREAAPDVRLRFVWVGPVDDPDAATAAEGQDDVVFTGPQANPYPLMNRFDIATLPSRDDPFPLVVMEAMLLGKPVVAFAVGGVAEQLGDTGVLVEPGDVPAFAAAILSLVRDRERGRELGRAAARRAETYYTPEGFGRTLSGIVGVRPGPRPWADRKETVR
jgi:glycosyltransferase involved in cell wall biosynthesis